MTKDTTMKKNGARSDTLDFEVLLSLIFIGKKTIAGALIVTVGVTLLFSLVMPRRYESTAKILAEPQKEDNPYYIEVRSEKDRRMFLETQKEIIVSNSVVGRTLAEVEKKDVKALSVEQIDSFRHNIGLPSRAAGKNGFYGSGIGESNTFFVSVRDRSPKGAADAVNALVKNYIEEAARVRTEQAKTVSLILESAIEESRDWARQTHKNLGQFESETGSLLMELINMDKPTVRVYPELQELRAAFENARADIIQKKSLIDTLEMTLKEDLEPSIPTQLHAANPSIKMLKDKITDLRLQTNALKPYFSEGSREIEDYELQISLALTDLRDQVRLILDGEKQFLASLEAAQAERLLILNDYEEKMKKLSTLNGQHMELKREYLGAGQALNLQLQNLADARISAAKRTSGMANIAVIDYGSISNKPVSPRLFRNFFLSIPIGLAIGIILVLFSQTLYPIFVHPRQLEQETNVPVVALMHSCKKDRDIA